MAIQGPGGFCDLGYWCGAGTTPRATGGASGPTACAAGTFAAGIGLQSAGDCSSCPHGYVCTATATVALDAYVCSAGSFCPSGLATTGAAPSCAKGYHCPVGSVEQIPCSEGTYQPEAGKSTCLPCTAGNYCPFSATGIAAMSPCPAGHYCPVDAAMPAGPISPTPCAPGSYTAAPGVQACSPCPAGAYCAEEGLSTAGEPCPAGYSCALGSSGYAGARCPSGSSCPTGTSTPASCPPGKFCQGSGLAAPSGDCMAGYYCLGGASLPNPRDDPTGARCPKGAYCPEGASAPTSCPPGKYSDRLGASSEAFCLACPSGLTCTSAGLPSPSSDCPAGKRCSGATESPCSAGHYCPAGEAAELVCPPGTHQPSEGKASCEPCPAGSSCGGATILSWGGVVTPSPCEAGYYCPAGTASAHAFPCLPGSHGAGPGLQSREACTSCPAGQHCDRPGALAPTGACLDGFTCATGSIAATGTGPCPADSHCTGGAQTPCPAGTYTGGPGAASAAECIDCPPGHVCPDHARGLLACPAGRYCVGGAISVEDSDPAVRMCTEGHYCLEGSALPLRCPPGTSNSAQGATECTPCPVGTYCPTSGMLTPLACPADRECGNQGTIQPGVCPPGTHAQNTAAAGATPATSACAACPAGRYCWPAPRADPATATEASAGLAAAACNALYVCQSGSTSKTPYPSDMRSLQPAGSDFLTYNGPAYPGYRAEAGSTNVACPAGTYRPGFYGSECVSCPAGRYCGDVAMSSVDAYLCAGGHLCQGASTVATPGTASGATAAAGVLCPAGYSCPAGALHPMRCADGYYAPSGGSSSCTPCPAGSYCNGAGLPAAWDGTTSITGGRTSCPAGTECGGGTAFQPLCAAGKAAAGAGCTDCVPGSYCRGGQVAGSCAAGYFCAWGNSAPDPWGAPCPVGSYCPHGTRIALLCPAGTMGKEGSTVTGAKQASDCTSCQPGWLCPGGRRGAKPCPPGYFCPLLAEVAVPCPKGTWSEEGLL